MIAVPWELLLVLLDFRLLSHSSLMNVTHAIFAVPARPIVALTCWAFGAHSSAVFSIVFMPDRFLAKSAFTSLLVVWEAIVDPNLVLPPVLVLLEVAMPTLVICHLWLPLGIWL